ncbi:MAG: ATP-dependent RNA helicase DbpA [Lysobacteraceae bacterium]
MTTAFATLGLPEPLARACDSLGFTEPTPVQREAIGPALAGRDLLAPARTGSGKTLAFGLPLLAKIEPAALRTQALVLCPTRELADQVAKDLRAAARFLPNLKLVTLCGGIPLRPQLASLEVAPDVVVGTPGRLLELIAENALSLEHVATFVLDEADRMLDMGFIDDIRTLAKRLPKTAQTLLFSATFSEDIRAIAATLLREPVEIAAALDDAPKIDEWVHVVEGGQRHWAVMQVLADKAPEATLVFCNTRKETAALTEALQREGFAADALHGDLEQREREEVLARFANGSLRVLVATDVAARGIDIAGLPMVLSAEIASDADQHVHRIGRTGRAGETGLAVSIVTPSEGHWRRSIEAARGAPFQERGLRLSQQRPKPLPAAFRTLQIDAGRQDKLRPGDVMGALTGAAGLPAEAVGKISLYPTRCYVAVARAQAEKALAKLREQGIKGRKLRVKAIG